MYIKPNQHMPLPSGTKIKTYLRKVSALERRKRLNLNDPEDREEWLRLQQEAEQEAEEKYLKLLGGQTLDG